MGTFGSYPHKDFLTGYLASSLSPRSQSSMVPWMLHLSQCTGLPSLSCLSDFPQELSRRVFVLLWNVPILDFKSPAAGAWLLFPNLGWVHTWCTDSLAAPCICSTLLPYLLKHHWVFLSLPDRGTRLLEARIGMTEHESRVLYVLAFGTSSWA